METFDFPYHSIEDQYPETSNPIQFGRGYRFASKPKGPTQYTFLLTFAAFRWFLDQDGVPDPAVQPHINIKALIDFYDAHMMHEYFIYPHPWRGNLRCRFKTPLKIPPAGPNSKGLVEGIQLQLIYEP